MMTDTSFMKNKYTIDALVSHYLEEIKKLKPLVKSPSDETKLQTYYQAANAFKGVSVKDLVQFALSYGRNAQGKSAQIKDAFPIVLANRVSQPSQIDAAYARLLLDYTRAFKANRGNIKEWTLRFVLNSRFSPLYAFLEREIDGVISQTAQKIRMFESR
jgi:hypothetical protein